MPVGGNRIARAPLIEEGGPCWVGASICPRGAGCTRRGPPRVLAGQVADYANVIDCRRSVAPWEARTLDVQPGRMGIAWFARGPARGVSSAHRRRRARRFRGGCMLVSEILRIKGNALFTTAPDG